MVYISTHGHIYMYTYHYMSGYMLCVNAVVPPEFHFIFTLYMYIVVLSDCSG